MIVDCVASEDEPLVEGLDKDYDNKLLWNYYFTTTTTN
jgi:hypothetical protein